MESPDKKIENISFTIDAGLINRLGIELVGKEETAVSELIKNAYDADANIVELNFINVDEISGTLIIEDDGHGMNKKQLINGFMRISSGDKIDNPISPKYKRSRAGKKGIGRFATQRLGETLILTTQTIHSNTALEVEIQWNKYETKKELIEITHVITEKPKEREYGTTLKILGLRESWTKKTIERVFRYTSELIQPNYLSDIAQNLRQKNDVFEIKFYRTIKNEKETIADVDTMVFDSAIALIEGYVADDSLGYCLVTSERFGIDEIMEISNNKEVKKGKGNIIPFDKLKNVHFQAYYFIYNRPDYYDSISKMQLNHIKNYAKDHAGLRVYRNGFRVLPYGEPHNDWLNLDRRWTSASGIGNPINNKSLFGFIELVDKEGELFEEMANREGLIDNESFRELQYFMEQSIFTARNFISESLEFKKARNKRVKQEIDKRTTQQKLNDIKKATSNLKSDLELKVKGATNINIEQKITIENHIKQIQTVEKDIEATQEEVSSQLEELAMMRILSSLGLAIAEFVHEIQQFNNDFENNLSYLAYQDLAQNLLDAINDMSKSFQRFRTYTAYFDKSISRNVHRELEPINLQTAVRDFMETIEKDAKNKQIIITQDIKGYDLYTCKMHPSEWAGIFFNLYTNSKKAIHRARAKGQILIIIQEHESKIQVDFMDNGDGIEPDEHERIFNAFYTTSAPNLDGIGGDLTGSGLGLKIVKDIIDAYDGEIYVGNVKENYVTCLHIEIPKATTKELDEYGY